MAADSDHLKTASQATGYGLPSRQQSWLDKPAYVFSHLLTGRNLLLLITFSSSGSPHYMPCMTLVLLTYYAPINVMPHPGDMWG